MRALLLIFLTVGYVELTGQGPVISYSFDNCDATNDQGLSFYDGAIVGPVDCVCGLSGESFEINDMNESIVFPDTLREIFLSDFTIDFYFSLNNVSDVVDILSYRKSCNADSIMSLKYFPSNQKLLFEFARNISTYETVETILPDQCWNRFTLTRNELVYTLYLNNEEFGKILPDQEIPMHPAANMAFSGSPCQPMSESYFDGRIDELMIYDYALSEADLRNNYLYPDQIINQDTTIFVGSSVDILYGATCQSLISWSPETGLDDPTLLDPIASPEVTTTYVANTQSAYCSGQSEVTIYVLDPNEFDCNQILLPKAFTPNGDRLNDEFGISNSFIVETIETFYVLDRWGNKVFKTNDKNGKWDGTYNGERLNPGKYTYVIRYSCQGETLNKVGSVLLLV
jgi:gliding motility-associated-like protein